MTSYETLTLARHGDHVDVVTLTRPEARNALNTQMGLDLCSLFEGYQLDHCGARCIVLTGDGDKAFCAGGDLKQRLGMTDEEWTAQHLVFERMARAIIACPIPIIAAVNGAAFGGGCEIAACCDFIYAADTARFAQTEVKLGIIPGAGGTQNLPRAMGTRRATEVILTGGTFDAAQAHEWGLVNRVLPGPELMQAALDVAHRIAANAPLAVNQAKQSIRKGVNMSLSDGLSFEIEAYYRLIHTQDRHEGTAAFNEKRPPKFEGK